MRNFLLILAASFFLMVNGVQATEYTVPSPSVVAIENFKEQHVCSAVHVGDGNFLTARHCFSNLNYPNNFERTINKKPVYITWIHKPLDILLLKVPGLEDLPSAELACRDPILGEAIRTEGRNPDWGWVLSFGNVSGLKVEYEEVSYGFLHSASYVSGMSGGPVWDTDGKLLGINTAFINENTSISISNPLRVLCINIPGTDEYNEKQEKKNK